MIEKNIRLQPHHARDLLVGRRSDGRRPGYQPPGHRDAPSPSRGGPPGGGGGHHSPPSRPSPAPSRPAPAPSRPAPSPHRDVVTTAVAPPSVLSRPTPTPLGDAPGREFAIATQNLPSIIDDYNFPGIDTDFDKPTRNIHVDTGPEIKAEQEIADKLNRQNEIRDLIAQQQEEKFGPGADPTKFGETISDIARVTSIPEDERTIEDKLVIEDWEKDQDWDKVEELADKGESFEDIQKAMDKGLLLKEDAVRRKGLIERGLAAVMPKTKLENSLLGSLKKTFDPKRLAANFALKKMGLGWLNPLAGLASLFFPKQTAAAKSKLGLGKKQPKDMSAFKNLGLYADRQPTTTQYTKDLTAPKDKFATQIAKGTGLGSGYEMLGLHKGERDNIINPSGKVNQASMFGNTPQGPSLWNKWQQHKVMSGLLKEQLKEGYHQTAAHDFTQRFDVPDWASKGLATGYQYASELGKMFDPRNLLNVQSKTNPAGIYGATGALTNVLSKAGEEARLNRLGVEGLTEPQQKRYDTFAKTFNPYLKRTYQNKGGRIDKALGGRSRDI